LPFGEQQGVPGSTLMKKQYFTYKRVFDLVISCIVIIAVLSWITPIMALLIILDSRGPVFSFKKE
jgi:lipopolysaccharide/colanic/teichoic acid biosynthesis glycosyltransferase